MSKTYYENFLKEIQEEISKLSDNTIPTMVAIRKICETYGVDWKLEDKSERRESG